MVKILQAYNFSKQNTFSLNGEILAATLIDSNRIAVSSAEQFIEIYDVAGKQRHNNDLLSTAATITNDLDNINLTDASNTAAASSSSITQANNDERSPLKYTLATVGEVVNLIYCEAGKYLLTLEKENVGSPVHSNSTSISCTSSSNSATVYSEDDTKMFVRIYANFWKFPEAKLIDMPITIRIASMTTPKAPLVESIDVIELPLRSPPDLIQCCQTSGNVIVSSKDRIYLYEYTQCTHESTQPRFSYIDFLPFKFFVNLNFIPLKLSLAENVIACLNNRYCVAFKVVDVLATGGGGNHHHHTNQSFDNNYDIDDIDVDEAISSTESSIMSKASAGPSSHNSFETDSLETTTSGGGRIAGATNGGFPGRTPVDFNVARIVNSACGREFEVELKSQWDQSEAMNNVVVVGSDTQEINIMPTRASDIKIKLVNEAKAMNVQRLSNHNNSLSPYNDDNVVQYDIRKLLQICMKTSEPNGRIVDILRCMDLKAIYQRNPNAAADDENVEESEYDMGNQQVPSAITRSKHTNRRTLKSNKHNSCIAYAMLVASSVDGYLYQFCAQGKWYNENEKPIATYSFTAPVLKVHINDYVISAITTESVETHTSRIGHKLFNNRFEYPTIGNLFPEESSPDVSAPVAVIGLCSFMHVQFVCVNRDNLVLISNSALANHHNDSGATANANKKRNSSGVGNEIKRNIASRLLAEAKSLRSGGGGGGGVGTAPQHISNEWTLYNLEIPQVEHIIEDLEAIADSYRSASSTNFYDLMEEAHIMLRLSLALKFEKLSVEREQNLRDKFMENCRKLADFSIRSKKKEIYLQATGFYKMCNLQLTDIYLNYIENYIQIDNNESQLQQQQHQQQQQQQYQQIKEKPNRNIIDDLTNNAEQLIGLIYTVKVFLLNLGTDRLHAAFLNQLVKPFFTPNRVIEQGYPQVPLSLEFLNMFIKYSPADIPKIMLNSPVVADIISGELINYLKYLDKLNAEENLLLAVTACRMSNYLLAQEALAKTSRHDLAVALINHKNVLFDDGTVLYHKSSPNSRITKSNLSRRQHKHRASNEQAQSHAVVSFSDFTETILLATENTELIEAISDVFVDALCIEHSVSLDMILQLFLNYIASHIGHKGYQTSQKVFVIILQVFYYDLFDVNPLNNPHDLPSHATPPLAATHLDDDYDEPSSKAASLNSERDNESIANSIAESNESCASSSIDDHRYTPTSRQNRIIYDQLQDQSASPFKRNSNTSLNLHDDSQNFNANDGEINLKGLKILFRMYLGRLRALSELITDLQSADVEQQKPKDDFLNLRMECIKFMIRHLQEMRVVQQQQKQQQMRILCNNNTQQQQQSAYVGTQNYYARNSFNATTLPPVAAVHRNASEDRKFVFVPFIPDYKLCGAEFEHHIKAYIRPIPCLLERPQYLNRLPPFNSSDFSCPNRDEGESEIHFLGWHNELLTLTLKVQSLLASTKIDREIIEEFIAFIQKSPNLIGIDSFLVIILPKNLAINYMLNFCPEFMWQYGKSNNFTPKHWESLLRKILTKQELLPNWKAHITEILNNLVAELSFEELLQCFPSEVIQNSKTEAFLKEFTDNRITYENERLVYTEQKPELTSGESKEQHYNNMLREHLPMDNIDESNVFELTLRKAVSKQRSIALRSMIESTGTQLFDATSNPMYNL